MFKTQSYKLLSSPIEEVVPKLPLSALSGIVADTDLAQTDHTIHILDALQGETFPELANLSDRAGVLTICLAGSSLDEIAINSLMKCQQKSAGKLKLDFTGMIELETPRKKANLNALSAILKGLDELTAQKETLEFAINQNFTTSGNTQLPTLPKKGPQVTVFLKGSTVNKKSFNALRQWAQSNNVTLDFRGVTFSGDFDGEDFSGMNLRGANFENAILSHANFKESDLSGANLHGVRAIRTNFSEATLIRTDFSNAYLTGSKFLKSTLKQVDFEDTDLGMTHFDGATLEDISFKPGMTSLVLNSISFTGATLNRVDFNGTLAGLIFQKATLTDVSFENCRSSHLNIRGTTLVRCSLVNITSLVGDTIPVIPSRSTTFVDCPVTIKLGEKAVIVTADQETWNEILSKESHAVPYDRAPGLNTTNLSELVTA